MKGLGLSLGDVQKELLTARTLSQSAFEKTKAFAIGELRQLTKNKMYERTLTNIKGWQFTSKKTCPLGIGIDFEIWDWSMHREK